MRNLKKYQDDYKLLSYEEYHVAARKRILLKHINNIKPAHVLEIGCGLDPLGTYLDGETNYTLIEPAPEFYKLAKRKLDSTPTASFINSNFEEVDPEALCSADFVVVSCLLHELKDRKGFLCKLEKLFAMLKRNAICHISVPNANSLHRRLAVSMGLIEQVDTPSNTQVRMQQSGIVYDYETLTLEMIKYGFHPVDDGGIFLKPFTHEQMFRILEQDIIGTDAILGLEALGVEMKEISSEIWINFRYE
jgi:SAM-dependent methyltransferase